MARASEVTVERDARAVGAPVVDVPAEGRPVRVQWSSVAGATAAQVDSAAITLAPAVRERALGTLPMAQDGDDRVVTVPSGVRIRALTLEGLVLDNGVRATSSDELAAQGRRLTVTLETGGPRPAPQHAVPPCPSRGMIPQSLTGATFANRVLRLPDVAATRIRLSLVSGSFPEEFERRAMTLQSVSGLGAVLPRDLSVLEPDGSTAAWAFPGEMPGGTPALTIDLRPSLTKLAGAAIAAGGAVDVTYLLRGAAAARVSFRFAGAHGALLRAFPGVLEHTLEGDPVAVALGTASPLAAEVPSRATADLTVTYTGLRILDTVSDPVPASAGDIAGVVVGDAHVVRAFPPAAFDALAPARLGVFGRAPVECELSIQLVEMHGDEPGAVVAAGIARLPASTVMRTAWIDLSPMAPPARPLGCAVRATQGRFLWAAAEWPLVRVAVRDPDPGGRPLLLSGQPLLAVTRDDVAATPAPPIHLPARALPAAAFAASAPRLASHLFLKVDLADLTLGYGR